MCLTNKFPFAACTNQEIVVKSFNSSFNCVCQINLPSDVKENKDKYIFKYNENYTIKDCNILDKNDNEFEKIIKRPYENKFIISNYSFSGPTGIYLFEFSNNGNNCCYCC